MSLMNNMRRRLITDDEELKPNILTQLRILEPSEWPTNIDSANFGRPEIAALCERFWLEYSTCLNAFRDYIEIGGRKAPAEGLLSCLKIIPCSSAECERGFSAMNLILSDTRNKLLITNVSNLLFLKVQEPPLELFKPEEYVKTWLRAHRSAEDSRVKNVKNNNESPSILWEIM